MGQVTKSCTRTSRSSHEDSEFTDEILLVLLPLAMFRLRPDPHYPNPSESSSRKSPKLLSPSKQPNPGPQALKSSLASPLRGLETPERAPDQGAQPARVPGAARALVLQRATFASSVLL